MPRAALVTAVLLLVSLRLQPALGQSPLPDSPAIEQRVDALLSRMTIDEKITLIGGKDTFYTQAIPSIDLPRFKMSDGPVGVRTWGPTTAYTAGIALAATWDTDLARRVGEALGNDARARGVHILLAPGVNIYRSPLSGRNMEYFGEDPWLASRMDVNYIQGVQSKGVSATIKHFLANNSEYDRKNANAIIDERTLHEIYLPAFEAAVKEADVGAAMDSYNLINGEHATQNHKLNVDVLKKDFGFQGILMSDWDATYDGVIAANAGLDLEMPYPKFMNADALLPALKAGTLTQATIDDKVRRILRTAIRFGWLDRDQTDVESPLFSNASAQVARDEALESVTLLKNDGHLLPLDLKRPHTFVVLGPNAEPSITGGGGSSQTTPFFADSVLTGISRLVGTHAKLEYLPGLPTLEHVFSETVFDAISQSTFAGDTVEGHPTSTDHPGKLAFWREAINYYYNPHGNPGDQGQTYLWKVKFVPPATGEYLVVSAAGNYDRYTVKGSGATLALEQTPHDGPAYPMHATLSLRKGEAVEFEVRYFTPEGAPHMGFGLRAVDSLFTPAESKMISSADAVIVAAGFNWLYECEAYDRPFGLPWGQNELIAATVALNPHTIVDLQAGSAVDVAPWIDRVPALIDSWYGGQSAGEGLAQVIFGRSPQGRLPMSWERKAEDNPTYSHYYEQPGPEKRIPYAEGLFYGYRYYTSKHLDPLFPFGFGLSYTSFEISHLKLTPLADSDKRLRVEFDVRNTGATDGVEIAQVYVGDPSAKAERPVKELKAFQKVSLARGASEHVVLTMNLRAFSYYDTGIHGWRMDPGRFKITVGESSADDRLAAEVDLARP